MIFLVRCSGDEKNKPTDDMSEKGYKLVKLQCYTCHSPNVSENRSLAPPFAAIKKYYIKDNTTLEQFTEELTSFVQMPKDENVKIPGAQARYGKMARIMLGDEDLAAIAYYLYNNEIEKPDWYGEEYLNELEQSSADTNMTDIEKGKKYAISAKQLLSQNLLDAIHSEGIAYAVEFCNEKALPLTNQAAIENKVSIKRVSDKPRNKGNQANDSELEYIMSIKNSNDKSSAKPKLISKEGKTIAYYPIFTNQLCLNCHGNPDKDIALETKEKINKLYPSDKAIGYKENELRGIWVIEM